ncbi:tyrosine-type recombinase/integrase [Halobacillus sp. H74]|uniref:tyrosine-type recombinase/integrase n=1 Tax=Halobacillus sp. H74 TaxID=3457436 RepID=UPI003FCC9361
MLLKFAIQEFLQDREFQNLSKYTIKMYRQNLRLLQDYCTEKSIANVEDINSSVVKGFLVDAKQQGNQPSTLNNKLRSIKIFFNYLVNEDILEQGYHPTLKLKPIKEEIRIEVLSDAQIQKILKYYERFSFRNNSFYAYRSRMIIVFLLSTGVRRGELVNLKWSDVDFNNYVIHVYGKKRQVASIPFTRKLSKELAEYKVYLETFYGDTGRLDYVFPSTRQGKISDETISSMFKRLKKVMDFKSVRLSCHTFRHTFAHRSLMNGMDVLTLQKILRHENLEMTQRYVNLWGTALKEQNDRYNPLNNLDI